MTSLNILDTKNFMKHLLLTDTFDKMLTVEASLTTACTFHIDGALTADYYDEAELAERNLMNCSYCYWQQLRPFFLSLIKGHHTPKNFKVVFQLSPAELVKILPDLNGLTESDINGLYLNLRFDGQQTVCVTGTSLNIFTLDKSLDHYWDAYIQNYFKKKEIPFE